MVVTILLKLLILIQFTSFAMKEDASSAECQHDHYDTSGNLYCYKCDYEHEGDMCITMNGTIPTEICSKSWKCKVWRFFSENEDKKNYYFYRSCTNNCIPGCTPLDDVENRFMSCVSCCDYDFCNVDNASGFGFRYFKMHSLFIMLLLSSYMKLF
ncbi:CHD1 helical C-terminal domain containing protein [Trichinella spiralis]|uniref:CHD1 helical C-terminal domain containing protein n=1 Tax=Trichinella spiralis TaxID=6334 RepID=A0ABR3KV82_TRISP